MKRKPKPPKTAAKRMSCTTIGRRHEVTELLAEIKTTAAKSKRSGGGYSMFLDCDGGGTHELHFHLAHKL